MSLVRLLEKTSYPPVSSYQLEIVSTAPGLARGHTSPPVSTGTPFNTDSFRSCACCPSRCVQTAVFPRCSPSSLSLTILIPPLAQGSLSPKAGQLYGHIHSELSVPRSLALHTLPRCWSLYLPPSTAGGSFSDRGSTRHRPMSIAECRQQNGITAAFLQQSSGIGDLRSLICLVLSFWPGMGSTSWQGPSVQSCWSATPTSFVPLMY